MKELIMKKCIKCGATIKALNDCDCLECGIKCCNENMQLIVANSSNAVVEKHVPIYEIENDLIKVRVNHIMESDHYIEWICLKTENREEYVFFKPNEEPIASFQNVIAGTLYAYCNNHGLWSTKLDN